jgi:hypothetical protein
MMSGRKALGIVIALLLPAVIAAGTASSLAPRASAAGLDKEACGTLALELKGLQALKVEELMAKGPDWAVANLSQGDLNLIQRFIEVDEQIKFRCKSPSMLVKLPGISEQGDDTGSGGDNVAEDAPSTAPAPPVPARR